MKIPVASVALALCVTLNGCALLIQGMHQTVEVTSTPPQAAATFGGEHVETPGKVTISRRESYRILRAEHPGFVGSCKLVPCRKNRAAVALSSIPAAIPLAIDGIFGTLHICPDEVAIELEPERPGVRYADVPTDLEIYRALDRREGDLCDFHRASRLLVFGGEPPRPYEILGEVRVTEEDLRQARMRMTPETLDRFMRKKALDTYKDKVDAIIGTGNTYEGARVGYHIMTGFRGEAAQGFARGLAVRFTGVESRKAGTSSMTDRLRELEEALRGGLITQDEFDRKKAQILDEL